MCDGVQVDNLLPAVRTDLNCNFLVLLDVNDPLSLLEVVSATILFEDLHYFLRHEEVLSNREPVDRYNFKGYQLGLGVTQDDFLVVVCLALLLLLLFPLGDESTPSLFFRGSGEPTLLT